MSGRTDFLAGEASGIRMGSAENRVRAGSQAVGARALLLPLILPSWDLEAKPGLLG